MMAPGAATIRGRRRRRTLHVPALRYVLAGLVLANGAVHFDKWREEYRHIPDIGPMFVAQMVTSLVLAIALVVRPDWRLALATVAFEAGVIVGFVLARTTGILGFETSELDGNALASLVLEGVAIAVGLAIAGDGVRRWRRRPAAS